MATDHEIEKEIQAKGLTAPRITPVDIEANIRQEFYFTAAEAMCFQWITADHSDIDQRNAVRRIAESIPTRSHSGACSDIAQNANGLIAPELTLLTFCILLLRNGFTVTGESACASAANFNADVGKQVARQNAIDKIWPLMGYELRSNLHQLKLSGLAEPYPS